MAFGKNPAFETAKEDSVDVVRIMTLNHLQHPE
jgi:hypothetical protein